jgi:hypothetical protein
MSRANTTTDHEEIRKWIESRGGHPASVAGTGDSQDAGILRVDFGPPEKSLREVDWDQFFETFDERGLAFLYQDRTADGHTSRFFKFVNREEDEEDDDADDAE